MLINRVNAATKKDTTVNGMVFPTINSKEPRGETFSCSREPSSFSLTMDKQVKITAVKIKIIESRPGIKNLVVLSSGLYQNTGRGSIGIEMRIPVRAKYSCEIF